MQNVLWSSGDWAGVRLYLTTRDGGQGVEADSLGAGVEVIDGAQTGVSSVTRTSLSGPGPVVLEKVPSEGS